MMGRVTADDGAFRSAVEQSAQQSAQGSTDGRPPRPIDETHGAAEADEATQATQAAKDGEGAAAR